MPTPFWAIHGDGKKMEPSFEKFLGKLLSDEVCFIVVGGLAVTLNGYVRLTEDVDLLVGTSPENLEKLIRSLSEFGEGYGGELVAGDFTPEPGAIRIIEETEALQVDLFTCLSNLTYDDLFESSEQGTLRGKPFRYASKSQLVTIKSESVREKDQLDVMALRQLIENPGAFD
jgi:hypothetical protein